VVTLDLSSSAAGTSPWWVLAPGTGNLSTDVGTFYRDLPDQAIVQMLLLAGIAVAAAGLLGLIRAGGGPRLRVAAAAVTVAGLAAAVTATGLAGTARLSPDGGYVIPAFGDAANDGPAPYTPACQASPVRVCVNPAFRAQLPQLDTAIAPFLRELAGLPGAPASAEQISATAGTYLNWNGLVTGTPPAYEFTLPALGSVAGAGEPVIVTFIGGNNPAGGDAAQQAVELALLRAAGSDAGASWSADSFAAASWQVSAAVTSAAARLAALPATARHAWLATHLAALRAGHITLEQLP
jgi:hypothetical protein